MRARGRASGSSTRDGLALLVPHADARRRASPSSPPSLRDVDAARFDAGVLPAVPGVVPRVPRRRGNRRRAGREGQRRRPRCSCARSTSTRSGPRPPRACACRRRPRSSRRSRAPAWCSAASIDDADRSGSVDFPGRAGADQRGEVAGALTLRPRRRAGAAPRPRTSDARRRGTRRSAWASWAPTRAARARTRATGCRGARRAPCSFSTPTSATVDDLALARTR